MSAAASHDGTTLAGALALQRVLALEGRDVLSRVELAASELDRFALAPALGERIASIREAVAELDAVLDKIERLADPLRRERPRGEARFDAVFGAIRERIAPALAARGIVLDGPGEGEASRAIAIPAPVLERLLLLWLRTVIQAFAGEEALDEGRSGALVFVLELDLHGDALDLSLRPQAPRWTNPLRIERAAQTELDVALAEWGARAEHVAEGNAAPRRLSLPLVASAGLVGRGDV